MVSKNKGCISHAYPHVFSLGTRCSFAAWDIRNMVGMMQPQLCSERKSHAKCQATCLAIDQAVEQFRRGRASDRPPFPMFPDERINPQGQIRTWRCWKPPKRGCSSKQKAQGAPPKPRTVRGHVKAFLTFPSNLVECSKRSLANYSWSTVGSCSPPAAAA